jgi:hypothetical protein
LSIAFSHTRNVFATIDGSTKAILLAGLDNVLQSAGWVRSSVTGGFKYLLTSRQGLTAACFIRDLGATDLGLPCLTIQFATADESAMGKTHLLGASSYRTYDVIANGVHMFAAVSGLTNLPPEGETTFGVTRLAVCGGIPYVPFDNACAGLDPEDFSSVWWSSGSSSGDTFRTSWYHDASNEWSAYYNGELYDSGAAAEARLRLGAVAHPTDNFFIPGQKTQWLDGTPLYFDPLLAWGDPTARVRAQIYDAMLASRDVPIDTLLTTYERDPDTGSNYPEAFVWRCWSHWNGSLTSEHTYFGSLHVLIQEPSAYLESNYAY